MEKKTKHSKEKYAQARAEKELFLMNYGKEEVITPPPPREPTAEEVREGVWQYIIDHSAFTRKGELKIFFLIKSKENFWHRCNARIDKKYKRYDVNEIEGKLNSGTGQAEATAHFTRRQQKQIDNISRGMAHSQIASDIDTSGSIVDKLLLWCYRKIRNYLFKSTTNESN